MIEGKIEDAKTLRLRVELATGKMNGHPFTVTQNADGQAIFIEFEGCPRVMYTVKDMVEDSYNTLLEKGEIKNERTSEPNKP